MNVIRNSVFGHNIVLALAFLIPQSKTQASTVGEEQQIIQLLNTPAKLGSRSPNIYSKANKTLLSWLESNGEGTILYYSELIKDQWSKPAQIAKGDDWFVSEVDFPALAENNGIVLSSYLVRQEDNPSGIDLHLKINKENQWGDNFILNKKFSRIVFPSSVWMTSGWNWMPQCWRARFPMAAFRVLFVCPRRVNPFGSFVTVSP